MVVLLPSRNKKGINIKACRLGLKVSNPWNKLKTTEQYSLTALGKGYTLLEPYINDATEVLHKCNRCLHEWSIRPNNIINNHGCPICNKGFGSKFNSNNRMPEIAYLYVLVIELNNKEKFIKVGVTSINSDLRIRTIKQHLKDILYKVEQVEWVVNSGDNTLQLEYNILKDSKVTKYNIDFEFKGKTELLTYNSLDRIKEIINEKFC